MTLYQKFRKLKIDHAAIEREIECVRQRKERRVDVLEIVPHIIEDQSHLAAFGQPAQVPALLVRISGNVQKPGDDNLAAVEGVVVKQRVIECVGSVPSSTEMEETIFCSPPWPATTSACRSEGKWSRSSTDTLMGSS